MRKIVVFCGSSLGFNTIYKDAAITLGNYFVANDITLVYGGGKIGMMGVLSETILSKGGKVIGVIPEFLKHEEVVNSNVTELIVTKTMSERKVIMSQLVDGYISLPGGFGTLDELFEVLTLGQLHIEKKPNGLLNINGFFNPTLKQFEVMIAEGYLKQSNRNMLLVADNVSELMLKMDTYTAPKKSKVINKVVKHDH
ncbi:MAG: LOG family protein YvdD [Flavobacterium sp. SCGC AAA160-P02]|nr:MAG: LOG family protein YvdD [Flavobacterium sp. SCGC AAA160-P02]